MKLIEDLGMQYPTETSKRKARYGMYECSTCKIHFRAQTQNVKHGKSTKCRDCNVVTHGMSGTELYTKWIDMRKRCYVKHHKSYKYYGGKGIRICDEWLDFEEFYKWSMENGYEESLTIERIDSDKNYEPSNCEFITKSENTRRSNIKISEDEASGICQAYATGLFTQKEIALSLKVSRQTISSIICAGRM